MKRLGLMILLAAVAAGGVVYTIRRTPSTPHATVTTLLPAGTAAFAHVPDFRRTREEWRESDICKLYQERAVQDFLKPLKNVPRADATSDTMSDLERLDPKDAFLAVTSIDNNNPHLVGGFRFHGSQSSAEEIIGKWRARLVTDTSARETLDHAGHKIDIVGAVPNQVATVYDGQWFFTSNDLEALKAVLDRADGRDKDRQTTLEAEETFRAAMAHMPSSYALLFYLQPKKISGGLTSIPNSIEVNVSNDARTALEQIHTVCAVARFEKGKIHDFLFAGMPKAPISAELSRSSISLASADTFLYVGALLNPDRLAGAGRGGSSLPLGSWLQKVFEIGARSGLTAEDWKAAFDLESSALAEWPQTSHLPSVVAVLPVKDAARALKIADALTKAIDEDVPWRKSDRNGVRYYYMQSPIGVVAITPTIAVSDRQMIVGLDSASVEAAIGRAQSNAKPGSTLSDSSSYKAATRAVPNPTTGFAYVDTGLLYVRLDAALRPILLMSAAFMPAISDYVDVTKLPPPETVTKHLSPIVLSQRYERDGYVTESIGPVSLDVGLGLPALGWLLSQENVR